MESLLYAPKDVAVAEQSTDDKPQALKRTTSQALEQQRVQKILQGLSNRRGQVKELVDSVMVRSLGLAEVEEKLQKACSLNVELLDDMLALDSLSRLVAEDRQDRRAVLVELQVLEDQVEDTKLHLQEQRKQLEVRPQKVPLMMAPRPRRNRKYLPRVQVGNATEYQTTGSALKWYECEYGWGQA